MAPDLLVLALELQRSPIGFAHLSDPFSPLPESFGDWLIESGAALAPSRIRATAEGLGTDPETLRAAFLRLLRATLLLPQADHYRVLGLPRTCPAEAVKRHHGLLLRLLHPDRTPGADPRAVQLAARVNQAYQVLRDPEARRRYDGGLSPLSGEGPIDLFRRWEPTLGPAPGAVDRAWASRVGGPIPVLILCLGLLAGMLMALLYQPSGTALRSNPDLALRQGTGPAYLREPGGAPMGQGPAEAPRAASPAATGVLARAVPASAPAAPRAPVPTAPPAPPAARSSTAPTPPPAPPEARQPPVQRAPQSLPVAEGVSTRTTSPASPPARSFTAPTPPPAPPEARKPPVQTAPQSLPVEEGGSIRATRSAPEAPPMAAARAAPRAAADRAASTDGPSGGLGDAPPARTTGGRTPTGESGPGTRGARVAVPTPAVPATRPSAPPGHGPEGGGRSASAPRQESRGQSEAADRLVARLERAFSAGDIAGLVSLFTANAEVNGARGAEAVRRAYRAAATGAGGPRLRITGLRWRSLGNQGLLGRGTMGRGPGAESGSRASGQAGPLEIELVPWMGDYKISRLRHPFDPP